MLKLVLRFFVICIILTVVVSFLILKIQSVIEEKNALGNFKLITQGVFYSLDEILKKYPEEKWQSIINKMRPENSGLIKVIPISSLPLDPKSIDEIKHNQILLIYEEKENSKKVYKKINDSYFAYEYIIDYNDIEEANRIFGWAPFLVNESLKHTPQNQWPSLLETLSKQYGYPVLFLTMDQANLNQNERDTLKKNQWVMQLPNKTDDSIQILYVPSLNYQVLKFGPIYLPYIGVYQKYILFVFTLLFVEIIIFIIALLFSYSLDKLNQLANEYGKGNFDNKVQLNSASILYPLFNHLKIMGQHINHLIASHKELTNTVSHEIRTPISRLRISLELLRESKSFYQVIERSDSMEEDIQELEGLVSEILTYAQLDRYDLTLEKKRLSLNDLIDQAIHQLEKSGLKNKLKMIKSETIYADVNARYFLRAILNLLQNADRFAKLIIIITLTKINEKYCQLIIEDDGPGIAEEDKEKVFQPFIQLKVNQALDHKNYGFGLAITQKIIVQHYWKIMLEDSSSGGARFVITIPVA